MARTVRRRLLDRDLELVRNYMNGLVLEVGAGRAKRKGQFQPSLDSVSLWIYLDLNPDCHPHLCADCQHLPFPQATFNTVISLEVLEYITSPLEALIEFRRILVSGGILILSIPFMHRYDAPNDYWRFSESNLRRFLAESSFSVTTVHTQGGALAVVASVVRYIVYAMLRKRWQRPLQWGIYPLLRLMLALDEPACRRVPTLRAFSTGYLLVARAI